MSEVINMLDEGNEPILLDTQEEDSIKRNQRILKASAVPNQGAFNFFENYGSLLAVGIGATPIIIAYITAIRNLGQSLLQGFWGRVSDNVGRKIVIIVGLLSISVIVFVISLLNSPLWYLFFAGLLSIAISAVLPSWNALQGDLSTNTTRTKFISQIAMIGSLSAAVILLIGGFLINLLPFSQLQQYRVMLLISSALFAIVACIFMFLKEDRKLIQFGKVKRNIFLPFLDKNFRKFSLATMFWWFIMSMLWPLYPYVVYGTKANTFQIALLSLGHLVGLLISQYISGKVSDKIGRRFTIFIGLFIISFVPLILAHVYVWYILIFSNFLAGIANGFMGVALNSEILHQAKIAENRGSYTGSYNMLQGSLTFLGALSSGLIFELMQKFIPFDTALFIVLASLASLRLLASIPVLLTCINENHSPLLEG